jgi:hypothetical protein
MSLFFFEKLPQSTQSIEFYCPASKQMIVVEEEDFMIEEE